MNTHHNLPVSGDDAVSNMRAIVRIALFAAIIAALGLLPKFDLPLLPGIPVTAQTLGVMLAGIFLGARNGALAVLLFLFVVAVVIAGSLYPARHAIRHWQSDRAPPPEFEAVWSRADLAARQAPPSAIACAHSAITVMNSSRRRPMKSKPRSTIAASLRGDERSLSITACRLSLEFWWISSRMRRNSRSLLGK